LGSVLSRERFWKSLLKRVLDAGEKRCKKDLEGDEGGEEFMFWSGSEMVMKEESSETLAG